MRTLEPLTTALAHRHRTYLAHLWDNVALVVLLTDIGRQRATNRPLWFDLLELEYAAARRREGS